MKKHLPGLRAAGAAVLVALSASSVGCYSTAYPQSYQSAPAYTDSKGYQVPGPEQPAPPQQYGYSNGVNPGWVVAGAAAAGLLGYAIGHNHHSYYGPGYYYGAVPYGYGYGYGYRGGYRGPYHRHW